MPLDTPIMPPEWAKQDWLWIGFPHAAEEWPDVLGRSGAHAAMSGCAILGRWS